MGHDPAATNPLLEQAAQALRRGRPGEAQAALLALTRQEPGCAHAWHLLGAACHRLGRIEAALASMERALLLDPELADARRAAATLQMALGRPREALAQIEELFRRRPAEPDFLADAGVVLEALGEAQAALARYDAALAADRRHFRARLNRGAHTTAADALWAGLPVLTCAGRTMASRLGASIVRAAGLAELAVADHAAYEAAALRLATQPQALNGLRERLARHRRASPLFDTARRARELECAFLTMWRRHRAGLAPESFVVPPAGERDA
jgi:predicted O-linked N-acetylglucosamine transferase (SPINDLY family)